MSPPLRDQASQNLENFAANTTHLPRKANTRFFWALIQFLKNNQMYALLTLYLKIKKTNKQRNKC